MRPDRKKMYKLPYSVPDNQGAWIEVTDNCNLNCYGCYRNRLNGDLTLEEIFHTVDRCIELTNCDEIVIAGGEPLVHPQIKDVIQYITDKGKKSLLLTNGDLLGRQMAMQLKDAGLTKIHFHIDSLQNRDNWQGKNEKELNGLRQYYADLLWEVKGIQCGFHVTVNQANLPQVVDVLNWTQRNIEKVQHLSLIALRGIPRSKNIAYYTGIQRIPDDRIPNQFDADNIDVTTDEMYDLVQGLIPGLYPCAYINGKAITDINKYLIYVIVGTPKHAIGCFGAKSIELVQILHHLIRGRYLSFSRKPRVGKMVFFLGLVDRQMRKAFGQFLLKCVKNPLVLFRKIYTQSILIQQPIEFIQQHKISCDSCVNPMIYKDLVINPCQLDEYRLFGREIMAYEETQ
jgi:organic radical activating enzyme